jgi:hypothetical protein
MGGSLYIPTYVQNIEKFDLRANLPWLEFLIVSGVYHYSMTDDQGYRHALAIGPGSVRVIYKATTGQPDQTTRLPQLGYGVDDYVD